MVILSLQRAEKDIYASLPRCGFVTSGVRIDRLFKIIFRPFWGFFLVMKSLSLSVSVMSLEDSELTSAA